MLGLLFGAACTKTTGGHGSLEEINVLIDGDSGARVTITHLTRNPQRGPSYPNVEVTREVVLPFSENMLTDCWDATKRDDKYLKVATNGDVEIKVAIFDAAGIPMRRDTSCFVVDILFPIPEGESCRQRYSRDSVYAFLEEVKYPAYKKMQKGETSLEIAFDKVMYGWLSPYFASNEQ